MRVKTIIDEDFVNYKKPSMFIGTVSCGGKCCIEANMPLSVCQNDWCRTSETIFIGDDDICRRYISNPITSAIVFGGLEPFEQFEEVFNLISKLRMEYHRNDTIVIYTGYNIEEISYMVDALRMFSGIVVKFGRFVPNKERRYDNVLGVYLASPNQYAEKIS